MKMLQYNKSAYCNFHPTGQKRAAENKKITDHPPRSTTAKITRQTDWQREWQQATYEPAIAAKTGKGTNSP